MEWDGIDCDCNNILKNTLIYDFSTNEKRTKKHKQKVVEQNVVEQNVVGKKIVEPTV